MYSSDLYFKIFSNCFIVKGANISLVLDLQRNYFIGIPDTMHEVIEMFNSKNSIQDVYISYGLENKEIIDEYLAFLIEKEFGFIVNYDEFELFTDMDTTFDIPSYISNCIVELTFQTIPSIDKIINDLESLYCKNLQLICYENISIEDLKKLLTATMNNSLRSIELVLKYTDELFNFIPAIDNYNFRITQLTLHSAKDKNQEVNSNTFIINFLNYELKSFLHCGIVDMKYFSVNKNKVLESLNNNSCLNKKLSIDKDGNIKNCPSMTESFGNIKNTTLNEALNHPNFKKYWNINKE